MNSKLFALIIIFSHSCLIITSDDSSSLGKRKLEAIVEAEQREKIKGMDSQETLSSFSPDFFCSKCRHKPCSHIKIHNGNDIDRFVLNSLYDNFINTLHKPSSVYDSLHNVFIALQPYDLDQNASYRQNKYRQRPKNEGLQRPFTQQFCNNTLTINDEDEITPLSFVASKPNTSWMDRDNAVVLLNYGANPNILSGKTDNCQAQFSLDFAKNKNMIELLIKHGGKASLPKTIDHLIRSGLIPKIILLGEKIKFSHLTIQACRKEPRVNYTVIPRTPTKKHNPTSQEWQKSMSSLDSWLVQKILEKIKK